MPEQSWVGDRRYQRKGKGQDGTCEMGKDKRLGEDQAALPKGMLRLGQLVFSKHSSGMRMVCNAYAKEASSEIQ